MEAEAEKLKVLQSEVEKQMSMGESMFLFDLIESLFFDFSPNWSTTVSHFRGKSRRRQSIHLCWPGKLIKYKSSRFPEKISNSRKKSDRTSL